MEAAESNVNKNAMMEESKGGGQESAAAQFDPDEKVFAKDKSSNGAKRSLYYLASVRDRRYRDGQWQYKVHYHGWNSRWDQWISDDAILRATDQNQKFLEISGLLEGSSSNNEEESDGLATAITKSNALVKRKREDGHERSSYNNRKSKVGAGGDNAQRAPLQQSLYEEFCELPFTLKTVLVEEMERITRIGHDQFFSYDYPPSRAPSRLLHQLPASVTIQQVLKHFAKKHGQNNHHKNNNDSSSTTETVSTTQQQQQLLQEATEKQKKQGGTVETAANSTPPDIPDFCQSLANLFQECLAKFLLYPQERPQYENLKKDPELSQKPLVEIYGCEFLLRLYVRLPVLLQQSQKQQNQKSSLPQVQFLGPLLANLLVLLQKNRQACFRGNYREIRPDEWMESEKIKFLGGNNNKAAHVDMDVGD